MGWVNETPNIALPQFVDADKPTWRGDVNYAFNAIDAALGSAHFDEVVSGNIGDPESLTRAAIDANMPMVSADIYGMSPTKTGTENKTALLAAHMAGGSNRAVFIPAGRYDVDPISDTEFGVFAPRLIGTGARVNTVKRWDVGSPNWATDGPVGTVLHCAVILAEGEPFIHIGSSDTATSTTLKDIAIVGDGVGIGIKAGQDVGGIGGGWPIRWNFQNLTVANFDVGMTHTGENGVMVAPYIVGCRDGFYAGYPWNGNTVIGINVERCSRASIRLNHAICNIFIGGVLQANTPELANILIENSSQGNIFEGLYNENYAPATGLHPGVLHEVDIGRAASGGACYGNKFRNMQWGSTELLVKIVTYNSYFSEFTMDHGASGTTQPDVDLSGGWGHEVTGLFGTVTGAHRGRVRHTTGVADALGLTETYGWNLATSGFIRVGNALTSNMPDAAFAGKGALHRNQQMGVLMESDGTKWEPLVSRIRPFTTAAGGVIDAIGLTAWLDYTHIKTINATGFKLWNVSSATQRRAHSIRNGSATTLTISVQTGDSINGVSDGTLAITAGNTATLYIDEVTGQWMSV